MDGYCDYGDCGDCNALRGPTRVTNLGASYRVIFLTEPPLNMLSVDWYENDFKKKFESQTGSPPCLSVWQSEYDSKN